MNFIGLALVPPLLAAKDVSAVAMARRAWMILGGAIGSYALFEVFILKANPLYDWAYQSAGRPLLQSWSVYRATTTLGHPLVNGIFFAVAAVLALDEWLRTRGRMAAAAGVLAAGGLMATASRGSLGAAAVGALVVVVVRAPQGRKQGWAAVLALGALGTASSFGVLGHIAARNVSQEGASSFAYRTETVHDGIGLVQRGTVLGAGPGLADETRRASAAGETREVGLENSWLQLLVSLGIPGGALIVTLLLSAARRGWQCRNPTLLGSLAVYVVAAGTFNLVEAHLPNLVFLGVVLSFGFLQLSATETSGPVASSQPRRRAAGARNGG